MAKMTKRRYFLPWRTELRSSSTRTPGFELLDAAGPASVFAAANFALSQLG
jgi:hypothetical protein